jgi:hypothetical protein
MKTSSPQSIVQSLGPAYSLFLHVSMRVAAMMIAGNLVAPTVQAAAAAQLWAGVAKVDIRMNLGM